MNVYKKRMPVIVNPIEKSSFERRLSLDGKWAFRLDEEEIGISCKWYNSPDFFCETIEVPGCWQGQGFGDDSKEPVWDLGYETRVYRASYTGTAWYARSFSVPEEWKNSNIWINFGGIHPSAEIWLNGEKIGENSLPFVPFGFNITENIHPDKENLLVVRVHEKNRILGLAYNWQGNFSGLYRGVELTSTGANYLEYIRLYPDIENEKISVKVKIGGNWTAKTKLKLHIKINKNGEDNKIQKKEVFIASETAEIDLPIIAPSLWSPDTPDLYCVETILKNDGNVLDAIKERTGFVKLSTDKTHFLINDIPYYLRGTLDFLSNPETGSPDTNRDRWRKKLSVLKEYGFNRIRCQSFVHAPEFFDVADELGILIQSEMGMLGAWGGHSYLHIYQWPQPTPDYREDLEEQWNKIVERDVNHPSAIFYCMSNEWFSKKHLYLKYKRIAWKCYNKTKALKPNAFVFWTNGGNDETMPSDLIVDQIKPSEKYAKPTYYHEFGFWTSLPDVRLINKFSGAVKPFGELIALEAAKKHGIDHVMPLAAYNSQRLLAVEMKLRTEACRRDNAEMAGIEICCTVDRHGTPQGVLDAFYEKKYQDSREWLYTNGDTVILSNITVNDVVSDKAVFDGSFYDPGCKERILTVSDSLKCRLFVSDFSHPSLINPELSWSFITDDSIIAQGIVSYEHKPYETCFASEIVVRINDIKVPKKAYLKAVLKSDKKMVENCWDFWLIPEIDKLPENILIYSNEIPRHTWMQGITNIECVHSKEPEKLNCAGMILTEIIDETLLRYVESGGCILLAASEGLVRPLDKQFSGESGKQYFFTPPANYPVYENGYCGTIINEHPIFFDFPHEGFADLQFIRMMWDMPAIDLEGLKLNNIEPIFRVMHQSPVGRSLAHLIECGLGKGRIILCSLNLDQNMPEARYMLSSICNYAGKDEKPDCSYLTEEALEKIIKGTII